MRAASTSYVLAVPRLDIEAPPDPSLPELKRRARWKRQLGGFAKKQPDTIVAGWEFGCDTRRVSVGTRSPTFCQGKRRGEAVRKQRES